MTKDLAETLVDDALELAADIAHLEMAQDRTASIAHQKDALVKARRDLIQMLRAPSPHSEGFPSVRNEFKIRAPVSIADVLKIVPTFNIARDTDRAGMWAIMAQMRGEYADAMMEVRKGSTP